MYNLHLDFIFAVFLLFSNICCNGQPNSNGTKDLVILEAFHQEVLEVQNDGKSIFFNVCKIQRIMTKEEIF